VLPEIGDRGAIAPFGWAGDRALANFGMSAKEVAYNLPQRTGSFTVDDPHIW
jgi:hypothetical protein